MYFTQYRKDLDSFGTEDQNKYNQATVIINIIVTSLTSSFCSLRFKINGVERAALIYLCNFKSSFCGLFWLQLVY